MNDLETLLFVLATNKPEPNTILTKRPHLPTKAKNHLKKWLFRHTEVSHYFVSFKILSAKSIFNYYLV